MKIPTKTRYGVTLMLHLALYYGKGPLLLREIAKQSEISEKYLGQIIIPLKASGFIRSVRGSQGGYLLAQAPQALSLKDIFEAIEGKISINGAKNSPGINKITNISNIVWERLQDSICNTLEELSLGDLLTIYSESEQKSFTYNI